MRYSIAAHGDCSPKGPPVFHLAQRNLGDVPGGPCARCVPLDRVVRYTSP